MSEKLKKPFFAGFLDKQEENTGQVIGGEASASGVKATKPCADGITKPTMDCHTKKYPSDSDESM